MPLILSGDTGVPASGMPTGSVIQTVNVVFSTQASSASSTYADTGLTGSITPISATSKILVLVNLVGVFKETNNTTPFFKLVRNSSDLIVLDTTPGYNNSTTGSGVGSVSTSYLDSPATTSSTSYKIQIKSANNNGTVYMNYNGYGAINSTITLLEIKA